MINLTDSMKQILVSGVMQIKQAVVASAFKYYSENDFEPTESNIPIFRDIVQCYAESGGTI